LGLVHECKQLLGSSPKLLHSSHCSKQYAARLDRVAKTTHACDTQEVNSKSDIVAIVNRHTRDPGQWNAPFRETLFKKVFDVFSCVIFESSEKKQETSLGYFMMCQSVLLDVHFLYSGVQKFRYMIP